MASFAKLIAAAALAAGPAAAQDYQPYQQPYDPYQQPYPAYPQQGYPQPGYPQQGYPQPYQQQGYGYDQQYGTNENVVGSIIDSLIGNRYNVSDRQAIRRCGFAAVQRAEREYRPYFSGSPFAYPGYRGYVRVSEITDVQRRFRVIRVRGLLDTARRGYGNGRRGADLSFRCDVDYRGNIDDLRIERTRYWDR